MRKLIVAFMVVMLIPASGFADERGEEQMRRSPDQLFKELDLDKGQIERIRKIHHESRREMVKIKSKVDLARIDFREELQKVNPDKGRLDKLIEELSGLKADKSRVKLNAKVETIMTLTPEQKEKLTARMSASMLGGHGDKRRGGFGGRRGF